MKSTMLAAAAQLAIAREDRLAQGHHRDSAKPYSRNDTFDSLLIQAQLAQQVAKGWRPTRSMTRGGQALDSEAKAVEIFAQKHALSESDRHLQDTCLRRQPRCTSATAHGPHCISQPRNPSSNMKGCPFPQHQCSDPGAEPA